MKEFNSIWNVTLQNLLDCSLKDNDFESFIKQEKILFKKWQTLDYLTYKKQLLETLTDKQVGKEYLAYINNKQVNIGVYPGSFDMFHVGHMSILKKAEAIFDKIIIARGQNLDKKPHIYDLPKSIVSTRQVESYPDLLTDFLDSLGYETTVIRGLRNATDLQHESTQLRFMQDFKSDIKMVSIFCEKELEHVSSSAIKMLEKYGRGEKYKIY